MIFKNSPIKKKKWKGGKGGKNKKEEEKKEQFGTELFLKLTLENGLNISVETFHMQNSAWSKGGHVELAQRDGAGRGAGEQHSPSRDLNPELATPLPLQWDLLLLLLLLHQLCFL